MTRRWYVLHLRPRCEKKVAEHCVILQLSHYLPLRRETKIYQRRKVTVEKPIFPGYCFVSFDDVARVSLLQTHHIVSIIPVPRQRELLHELAQIRRALRVDPALGTCEALKQGVRVRIKGGSFMGVEGLVATLKSRTRLCLNVELIGQAVALEVDRDMVEVIDS